MASTVHGSDSPSPSSHRRQLVYDLINRFVVQLHQGCGIPTCSTPLCATARSHSLSRPVRGYTAVSARAMAVVLASSDDAYDRLCPNLHSSTITVSSEAQERIDPKSIIQQLCNTEAFRKIHLPEARPSDKFEAQPHTLESDGLSRNAEVPSSSSLSSSAGPPLPMTCKEAMELWISIQGVRRDTSAAVQETASKLRSVYSRLTSVFGDFACLAQSFSDDPFGLCSPIPITRLDSALRSWVQIKSSGDDPSIIFDCLWIALEPLFESPFSPRSQWPKKFLTFPSDVKAGQVIAVAHLAIHALTSSIPRGPRAIWHVVWSTIINGRAYGKQKHIHDDLHLSPWLYILDAFEYEPALRMSERLIRAIGARTCLEETLSASGADDANPDPALKAWKIPSHRKLRRAIISMLVREEQSVRSAKFKTACRGEIRRGRQTSGTTSLVWLEWLRKCFLKNWDGSFRINRWSVAGSALELIEDLWRHRGSGFLDMPEDLFATPVVFNQLDIDKAAQDWMSFKPDVNTRHLLSFKFLFSTRATSSFVRSAHHNLMQKAYGEAEALWQMRRRTMPHTTFLETGYLNRRLKAAQDHYLVLKINRHSILSDAFDQLWHREKRELLRPLRVRMGIDEGEIGHDLGGVQIEFFKLACQEAFRPDYSLFSVDPQTRLAWFQPATVVPLYKHQLFGLLFALAIYNGITLPVSFPLAFYKKLLFQPCDESDLAEGWPDLSTALKYLREYKGSVEDDFAREYVYSFSANGLHLDVCMDDPWNGWSIWDKIRSGKGMSPGLLKVLRAHPDRHYPESSFARKESLRDTVGPENHSSTEERLSQNFELDQSKFPWPGWNVQMSLSEDPPELVTNENRHRYIESYSQWVMDWSVRPQFISFAKGFYSVMTSKVLKLLDAEQFRTLVEGHNHLDIDALQRATTYSHYTASSPVVRWFWEVVKAYPQYKQLQLLEFVTASSRVPVNGAESLTFVVERTDAGTNMLPGSSTCFGTLRLPEYESKEILETKLSIALEHSLGFGQA